MTNILIVIITLFCIGIIWLTVRKRVKSYTPNIVWDVEVVDETLSQNWDTIIDDGLYIVRIDKKDENIA